MRSQMIGLMLVLASTPAWAGKEVGNGGGAFVCRNAAGKITSAELVDLFVAEARYQMKMLPRRDMRPIDAIQDPVLREQAIDRAVDEEIRLALLRLVQGSLENQTGFGGLGEYIFNEIQYARSNAIFIGDGVKLKEFDDSEQPVEMVGCPREQLANYTSVDELFINNEIWKKLDVTARAAFWIHEAAYRFYRETHLDETSAYAMFLVARIFSDFEFKPYQAGIPTSHWLCGTPVRDEDWTLFRWRRDTVMFWMWVDVREVIHIRFERFMGQLELGQIEALSSSQLGGNILELLKNGQISRPVPLGASLRFSPGSFYFFRGQRARTDLDNLVQDPADSKKLKGTITFMDPITGAWNRDLPLTCERFQGN